MSLDSSLRPACPSQHGIHRHHHQGNAAIQGAAFAVSVSVFRYRERGKIGIRFWSLSAAATAGKAPMTA